MSSEMEKYLEMWEENMRKQLGLSPKSKISITEEEWNGMTPKQKIKFIRDRRKSK